MSSSPLFMPDASEEANDATPGSPAQIVEIIEENETLRTTPDEEGHPDAGEGAMWRDWNEKCLPKIFAGFTVMRDVEAVRNLTSTW